MPREYRNIKQYENQLLDLRNQGLTYKEIADSVAFNKKQIQKFFERYRINQRKINTDFFDYVKLRFTIALSLIANNKFTISFSSIA